MIYGQSYPVGVCYVCTCDICGKPIRDAGDGAAVYRDRGQREGELKRVLHVHKGKCLHRADRQLCGEGGMCPWDELEDHLIEVLTNTGSNLRRIVNREVAWRCSLDLEESAELDRRLDELIEWLDAHGLSPLWPGAGIAWPGD
jgi:hypothetical protein